MMKPVNGVGGSAAAADPASNPTPYSTMQEIVAGAAEAKIQARHIGNHNLAEKAYISRQSLCKQLGLSEEVMRNVTPYPCPGNNSIVVNDTGSLVEVIKFLAQQNHAPSQPSTPPTPAPPQQPGMVTVPNEPRTASKWLLPVVAALGIGGAATTAYVMWPDAPPPVEANYEVSAR